jgi:hypothetical protein
MSTVSDLLQKKKTTNPSAETFVNALSIAQGKPSVLGSSNPSADAMRNIMQKSAEKHALFCRTERPILERNAHVIHNLSHIARPINWVAGQVAHAVDTATGGLLTKAFQTAKNITPECVKAPLRETRDLMRALPDKFEERGLPRAMGEQFHQDLTEVAMAAPMLLPLPKIFKSSPTKASTKPPVLALPPPKATLPNNLMPVVLEQRTIPREWLGNVGSRAEIKKGAYCLVQDDLGTYLSFHIDGVYANGEQGVLRNLIAEANRVKLQTQANRVYLVTEFRNKNLERALPRFGVALQFIEQRGMDSLYKVIAPSPLSATALSATKAPKTTILSLPAPKAKAVGETEISSRWNTPFGPANLSFRYTQDSSGTLKILYPDIHLSNIEYGASSPAANLFLKMEADFHNLAQQIGSQRVFIEANVVNDKLLNLLNKRWVPRDVRLGSEGLLIHHFELPMRAVTPRSPITVTSSMTLADKSAKTIKLVTLHDRSGLFIEKWSNRSQSILSEAIHLDQLSRLNLQHASYPRLVHLDQAGGRMFTTYQPGKSLDYLIKEQKISHNELNMLAEHLGSAQAELSRKTLKPINAAMKEGYLKEFDGLYKNAKEKFGERVLYSHEEISQARSSFVLSEKEISFVHEDLHPGNIIWNEGKMSFIDLGGFQYPFFPPNYAFHRSIQHLEYALQQARYSSEVIEKIITTMERAYTSELAPGMLSTFQFWRLYTKLEMMDHPTPQILHAPDYCNIIRAN